MHTIILGSNARLKLPYGHAKNEIGKLINDINQILELVALQLESERALRSNIEKLERRFRLIFERASVGIFLMDTGNRILMSNSAFQNILTPSIYAKIDNAQDCLAIIFKDSVLVKSIINEAFSTGELSSCDLQLAESMQERPRWLHCLFSIVSTNDDEDGRSKIYLQSMMIDITERKYQEQVTKLQAERDPLTFLHNRRSMEAQLILLQKKAQIDGNCFIIYLLDLDDFKPINDTFGHNAGDQVLQIIADRLRQSIRNEDIAARLGGDEFLVATIGNPLSYRLDVASLAGKLIATIMEEITLSMAIKVTVGVSIGVSVSSLDCFDVTQLMDRADKALYDVKKRGKNAYQIYE